MASRLADKKRYLYKRIKPRHALSPKVSLGRKGNSIRPGLETGSKRLHTPVGIRGVRSESVPFAIHLPLQSDRNAGSRPAERSVEYVRR